MALLCAPPHTISRQAQPEYLQPLCSGVLSELWPRNRPVGQRDPLTHLGSFSVDCSSNHAQAEVTAETARTFVQGMSMPQVMEFSQDRAAQIFRGPVQVHMLTFVDTKAAYFEDIKTTLGTVAEANRGKVCVFTACFQCCFRLLLMGIVGFHGIRRLRGWRGRSSGRPHEANPCP